MLPAERYRYHREVGARLERMADGRPVLLVVDDAHWADPASVELLAHLARAPGPDARCWSSWRSGPAQASERLPARAGRPARASTLGPLSRAEAGDAAARRARRRDATTSTSAPAATRSSSTRCRARAACRTTVLDALADELARALAGRARARPRRRGRGRAVRAGARRRRGRARRAGGAGRARRAAGRRAGHARRTARSSASAIRSCARPSMRSAGAGWRIGAHARVAAVLRAPGRRPGAARPPRRAVRAAGRHARRSRCSRAAAADVVGARPRGGRALVGGGAAAAAGRAHPTTRGWRCSCRWRPRSARRASWRRRATRCARSSALVEDAELRGRLVAFIALIEQLLGHQRRRRTRCWPSTLAAQPDPGSRDRDRAAHRAGQRALLRGRLGGRCAAHAADALRAARALGDDRCSRRRPGCSRSAEYHVSDVAAARALLDEAAARLDALSRRRARRPARRRAVDRLGRAVPARAGTTCTATTRGAAARSARATGQGYLLVPMTIGRAIALLLAGRAGRRRRARRRGDRGRRAVRQRPVAAVVADAALLDRDGHRRHRPRAVAVRRSRGAIAPPSSPATHWGGSRRLLPRRGAAWRRGYDARAELVAAAGGPDLPLIERAFKPQWYEVLDPRRSWRPRSGSGAGMAACLAAAETWVLAGERAAAGLGLPARTGAGAARSRRSPARRAARPQRAAETARAAARHSHQAGNVLEAARAQLLAGAGARADGPDAVRRRSRSRPRVSTAQARRAARRGRARAAPTRPPRGRAGPARGTPGARRRGADRPRARDRRPDPGRPREPAHRRRAAPLARRRSRRTSRTSSPSSACATARRRPQRSPRVLARSP